MTRHLIRPLATVSAGTLGSRLSGFLRDALIAALFGAGFVADAFLFAFQFVNVARRLLSEGALNAMLVPAYTRIRGNAGEAAAAAFAGRALGTIGLAVLVAAIVLGLAAPYAIAPLATAFAGQPAFQLAADTLRLMLPYLAFAGPVAVMAAVLNANGRVGLTAFSPVLFNTVMIVAVAVLLFAELPAAHAALTLAAVVGATGCFQLIFLGVSGSGHATPVRLSLDEEIRTLLRRALPGMIAQSGSQLFLVAGAVIASASPSAVAFLYFASRLVDLPLGLVGTATGAVLIPKLSRDVPGDTSSSALQLTLGLALPASTGLALLAHPIVTLLFEHGAFTAADTQATARALVILAVALPAFALARPMGAVFLAREQMTQPLVATLAGLAATALAGVMAEPRYGYAGVAAAISLGAWVTALWIGAVLALRNELALGATGWRNAAFIVVASAIMGGAIEAAASIMPIADAGNVLRLAIALGTLIALGLIVYAACLRLFGVVNFRVVRRAF
jgi:putative peptidoglycan lipid II flippase